MVRRIIKNMAIFYGILIFLFWPIVVWFMFNPGPTVTAVIGGLWLMILAGLGFAAMTIAAEDSGNPWF